MMNCVFLGALLACANVAAAEHSEEKGETLELLQTRAQVESSKVQSQADDANSALDDTLYGKGPVRRRRRTRRRRTPSPTPFPTPFPTPAPTPSPTPNPTPSPTPAPTPNPTPSPTPSPTPAPTPNPTPSPTPAPTPSPTSSPTQSPTPAPTTTTTTTTQKAGQCKNSCNQLYDKFAAKGQAEKGKKKACKKKKCQGCEMCASLLQANRDDAGEYDADDGAASLSEQSGSKQLDPEQPQQSSLCNQAQVQQALDQMHGKCPDSITQAVQNNEPLGDPERCVCYLQVDQSVADSLQCRTMAAKTHTLAEEYNQCVVGAREYAEKNDICALPDLTPYLNQMSEPCQESVYNAIQTKTALAEAERCKCYLQIEKESAEALTCHSMPGKQLTVAQEYEHCYASQQ